MANYILIHGAWHSGHLLEDTAMPQSFPWHPRLSEKLELFRLKEVMNCVSLTTLCLDKKFSTQERINKNEKSI